MLRHILIRSFHLGQLQKHTYSIQRCQSMLKHGVACDEPLGRNPLAGTQRCDIRKICASFPQPYSTGRLVDYPPGNTLKSTLNNSPQIVCGRWLNFLNSKILSYGHNFLNVKVYCSLRRTTLA